jgi:quinol monooxygenase YgiN
MKPVTQINFLSIKPGKIEEFLAADRIYIGSGRLPDGIIGSRLYRSLDGKSAVRVSTYESMAAQRKVHESDSLRQQIAELRQFVDSSSPQLYEEVER